MLGLDVLVELLETGELRSEAAFGSRVDDEDDLALEIGERVFISLFWRVWSVYGPGKELCAHVLSLGLKSKKVVAEDMAAKFLELLVCGCCCTGRDGA